jgi:hypothetical protein
MNTGPNRQRQGDSFAVMRCYRPTRIERELLTQIFDIVQRSPTVDFTNTTLDPKCGATALEGETGLLPREQRCSRSIEQQQREWEPAA